ncbi:LCP family protein [Micromonospora sp. CPCC 205711]|uniref:LCP family protein n=1 Tax=Micromonospora sp. CPCC 205547 TaxID=3122400 RepID=UPI002FF32932
MTVEEELRAAFARHEPLTPPTGPLRAAIDRMVVGRRRRRRRLEAGAAALAVFGLMGVAIPQFTPDRPGGEAVLLGQPSPPPPAPAGAVNVLLLGLDGSAPLADSVLIIHIPADRGRPYLVSLPRDMEVPIPGHGTGKLNSAFLKGAGEGRPDLKDGYELTRRTVSDLTGVRVDAGAVLTYPVLRTVTDELGGVEVCLPRGVRSTHTGRLFPAGCQRLDGAASVDLLRQRKGLPDGSLDLDRNAQLFAAGLVRGATDEGLVTNPARLSRLLAAVGSDVTVSSADGSLLELFRVVPELRSVEPVGLSVPVGPPPGQSWRLRPDPQEAPAFLAALRGDRLAGWAAAHPDRISRLR